MHFCLTTKISHLYEKGKNIHNLANDTFVAPTKIKNGVLHGVKVESILFEDKHITWM